MIFENNLKMVKFNNEEYEANNITYKLKINKYSDMFEDEIMYRAVGDLSFTRYDEISTRFQFNIGIICSEEEQTMDALYDNRNDELNKYYDPIEGEELPDEIDWRKLGAVTPVVDQGSILPI